MAEKKKYMIQIESVDLDNDLSSIDDAHRPLLCDSENEIREKLVEITGRLKMVNRKIKVISRFKWDSEKEKYILVKRMSA
ncbi:MAG: hypothetical protein CMH64_00030 [Nanoarchaeota archaeon]|nr:hypothetical protein [Nanoarchaeota archaeon]|tara:strand:+ start:45 stop:284 length:240 start_codon:yes stop_codon:yes gene_type:complete